MESQALMEIPKSKYTVGDRVKFIFCERPPYIGTIDKVYWEYQYSSKPQMLYSFVDLVPPSPVGWMLTGEKSIIGLISELENSPELVAA